MRRIVKYLLGALLVFALAVAGGTLVPRPLFVPPAAAAKTVTIYIALSQIHTDIILPADAISRVQFAFMQEALPLDNPNVKWLMFGWGGRSFYTQTPTWSELKPGPLLRGLTVDHSTMHVEVLGDLSTDSPSLIALQVSNDGLKRLRAELISAFQTNDSGAPQLIGGAAYGDYDQFYEANGYFNALIGCNTWTARMLRVAGLQTGLWNPFPQSLRISLNLYN